MKSVILRYIVHQVAFAVNMLRHLPDIALALSVSNIAAEEPGMKKLVNGLSGDFRR